MTITIAPFTVDPKCAHTAPPLNGYGKAEQTQRNHLTYWGIYIDDKHVSYTSSKELAEKTKIWMEKWLKDRI